MASKIRITMAGICVLWMSVAGLGTVWAQSQFPTGTASVGTSGDPNNGDRDGTTVLFFEIPDTGPATVYFAINDPGITGTAALLDQNGTGTSYWTLVGGTGALSDSSSQLITYNPYPSTQPLAGTVLWTQSWASGTGTGWNYTPGIALTSGEHIGNKYYFKLVLQVTSGSTGKNAFQADVSSTSGSITAIANAKSFAFGWSPFMSTNGTAGPVFNFYPFVPNSATGSITANNWDIDNTGMAVNVFKDIGGTTQAPAVTIGGPSVLASSNYTLGTVNGTWWWNVQANNTGTLANDLAEVWFTNGSTVLRTYSSAVVPTTPDHVTATYSGGNVPNDGTSAGTVTLQVVDSTGSPLLYSAKVWVAVSPTGTARIVSASNTSTTLPATGALVTTDGNGLATVVVTDTVAETVTITPYSDGTGGSDNFGTAVAGVPASVTFTSAYPTMTSSAQTSITTAGNASLPSITLSANGTTVLAATNLYIRVPSTLNTSFNTGSAPTVSSSPAGKVSGASFVNSSTLKLTLASNFTGTDTITISSGLQLAVANNVFSSGSLQLSYDGGASYPVSDSIATPPAISINTVSTYTWTGATNTNWSNAGNWSPAAVPPAGAAVTIPSVATQPTVDTGISAISSLSVAGGMTLSTGAYGITVTGATTIDGALTAGTGNLSFGGNVTGAGTLTASSGTTYLAGDLTVTNFSANGGTLVINGSGAQTVNGYGANHFNNIEVNKTSGTTVTAGSAWIVDGTLILTKGNFTNGTNTLTVSGNFSQTSGTFVEGTGGIVLNGSSIVFAGTFTKNSGGSITFSSGGAQSLSAGGQDLGNVTLSGAGTAVSLTGTATSVGNLTLTGGTFTLGAVGLSVSGNITRTSGILTSSGTVTLNGSAAQSVDFTGSTLSSLTVNNTFATAPQITLASSINVTAAFIHTAGTIDLNGHGLSVTGASSLGSTIQNSGAAANLNFTGAVTLTADTSLTTGGGSIAFGSTVNATTAGGQSLTLTAGAGNITFTGAVGATRLNLLTVNSAANVGFSSTVAANSVSQTTGTGTTTVSGNITTSDAAGVSITTSAISLGLVTIDSSAGPGPIALNAPVTLTGNVNLTSGGGNISFGSTVDATTAGAQSLTLTAGAGNITFTGAVGTTRLNLLTVNSAANVTFSSTVAANSVTQNAGTGTTTVSGNITASGAAGVSITTSAISLGPVTIDSSPGPGPISLTAPVTLTGNAILTSGGGNISFGSTVDATTAGVQSLTLTAGAGNITFTGAVGTTRLNLLTINSAANVTFSSTSAANAVTQNAGTGTTTVSGNMTASGVAGVSITTSAVSLGAVTINSSAGPGPIALSAPVTLTGNVNLTSGTATTGGNVSAASIDGSAVGRTLTVMAGTGGFSVGAVGTLFPLGTTMITANALTFSGGAASVKLNSAVLTLRPASAATTIGVGGGAGVLQVTAADLAAVANTCSGIVVGRATGTAAVTVNAVTVASPLSILAGGAGGTVAVNGQITATGATGITISSGTSTTLAADIRTNGGAIDLSGAGTNIIVGAASVTLATASGGSSSAAAITFGTNPVSANAGTYSLVIDASTSFVGGNGGNVTVASFNSAAGFPLQNLTIKTKGNGAGTNGSLTAPATYSLVIPGTTTIDIGTSSVTTLTNAANDFGTVAITSAANVTFNDMNAVILGPSSLTGTLNVSAGGAITESGILTANVLAVTNTTAGTNLKTQNNAISHFGPISASGQTVSLYNTAASDQAGGGAIAASSLELLGTGSYTLTNASNSIATLAGSVSAAVSYTNNANLSIGTVNTVGLTSTGAITLVSTGTLGQSQPISAASLSITSAGGAALAAANTVSAFSATNSGGGAIQLINTAGTLTLNGVSQAVSGSITITNTGNLTSAAAIASSGGIITLTASGAGSLFTNNSSIASSGAALNIVADDMALSLGTVNGGAGLVTLSTVTIGRTIDLGTDTAGDLGLTSAELNTITSTVGLTIGDTGHTGLVQISAACNPSGAGTVAIVNQTGGIAIGANFTANTSLTLTANGGGALVGAISRSAGTIAATAGSLTLTAATGIGVVGTAKPIVIGAVGGTISADNAQSGDLYLLTTAAASITLGGLGYTLTEANNGILRVDASGGSLIIGGNLSVGGAGSIVLNANGSITRTAGTLSAPTVLLGQTSATSVGASGAPIVTAATTALAAKSSAGDVWLLNTGNVNANAQSIGGVVDIVNAGTFTTNGVITSSASTVTLSSSGTVNIGNNVTGPAGVSIGVTTLNTALNQTAGIISTTNSSIVLTADNMSLAGTTSSGTGNVTLLPFTNGTQINLGGADAAGILGLTSAELATISVTAPGVLRIGNGSSGAVTVSAPVAPSAAANVHVQSGAGISGVGQTITATNLALSAGAAVNVSTSVSTIAAVTTAGGVTIGDAKAAGLTIGTVDGVVGISSGNTIIAVTETAGLLIVNQALNAGTSTASLTGVGVTNNSTVTGSSGITIAAGSGTFTNSGGATLTNGGGAALVSITADDMNLSGSVVAGSGAVNLTSTTVTQNIYLGTGATALGLSSAELNTITTTGPLTIGDTNHTGTISTDGSLTFTGPSGPVALVTRGGNITLNNAVTTVSSLSLDTTGSGATTGNVAGTGQLTIGALGANNLTVTTSNGISLTNAANLANAVSLTNGSAAGNIVLYNNRTMSLTASNAFPNGTLNVVNGTGNITISGAVSTTGPGTANINLQTPGSLTISNSITSGGSGFISLSAGTTTQTAIITAPGGLQLLGAGPYTLNGANVVGTLAANITGAGSGLSFNATGALTVGSVNGTNGLTTNGGNLGLTTSAGNLTISQPISTGTGTVTLNPATNISLSYATAVISTTNATVTLQKPVLLGANSVIASGTATTSFSSTIDDSVANTHSLQINGNANFGGVIGATPIASLLVTGTTNMGGSVTAITTGTTQEYDGAVTLGVDTNFTGGAGQLIWFKSTLGGGGIARAVTITTSPVQFDGPVGGAGNLVSTIAVNSGATTINANVTTTGTQTYGGPVSLGTDVNFTGTAGNLIWFKSTLGGGATARNVTITTAPARFDGAVGGVGNLVASLDVTAGTTALNANVTTTGAQTYSGAVTLGSSVATITATGALTFSSTVGPGTQTLTVQNAGSTGAVTFSGAVTLNGLSTGAGAYDITINNGGTIASAVTFNNTGALVIGDATSDVFTASSGMTALASTNTFQGTVQNDHDAGHDIIVSNLTVGAGGLTLIAGLSNFTFTGTVSVGDVVTAVVADPVDNPTDLTITAALVDGSISGTLKLTSSATVDIGSSNFNIQTLINPGVDVITNPVTKTITRNVGIIRLTGLQTTHTIATAGYSTESGAFLYYGTGGTIFTTGLVDASGAPGPYNYWDLIINGTFTPEANLSVHGSIRLRSGVLDGSNCLISVGSNWRNDVGTTAFTAGSNPLMGVQFLGLTNPVYVWGDNNWFMFICTVPGTTILFENNKIQRITTPGKFRVKSAGTAITLNRIDSSGGNPGNPPNNPGDDPLFWFFDLIPGATFDMNNVVVYYSNARSNPVSVPAGVTATPYTTYFSFKWLNIAFSIYSYTEDSDYNGKIDRIRVTTETNMDLPVDFSGFTVEVQGYEIDTSKGSYGYSVPVSGKNYYIYLKEKPYNDTNVTPQWHILNNTSFIDTGGKFIGTLSEAGGSDWMTPGDTAWPFISYTLAVPGQADAFIHLSEPVVTSGGLTPAATDFGFSGGLNPITVSGSGIQEASGTAPTAPTLANIAGESNLLTLTGSLRDMGHAPYWEPAYTNQVIAPPNPTYPPVTGYLADPNTYALAAGQTDADRIAANPFEIWRGGSAVGVSGANVQHRISDVLISVPPVSASDATYFVWPIWARDSVITEISESQYETLSGAEAASQTVGLVRDFTGTQWLRDQDITLQARVNPALAPANLSLRFDTNVDSYYKATSANGPVGLWLPVFNQGAPNPAAAFSGIVPYPNGPVYGGSTSLYGGTAAGANLWNFSIPANDPKVKSVSTLDFFFTLDNGSNTLTPLYAGRLDVPTGAAIPGDWYRRIKPFSFDIHNITKQRSNATILNNVIDPTKGERVRLSYQLTSSGQVTIQVFTLDGDLVQVLYRGSRSAGDYTASWDGKNRGGHVVARGMYFIRIVGPDIDEIRKVMVVKN